MSSEVINNTRIAKNTILLYFRMIIVIVINLYASRVILAQLGVDDYGIFNVVGGIVTMFGFLNNAMITSSQRFISYEQGRSDVVRQRMVYSSAVLVHWIIAVIVILMAESIGLWIVETKLNIPQARMGAACAVYHASVAVFVLKVIMVPDQASVVAHENMSLYALVSILDAVLQLVIIYILRLVSSDKLIVYALLLVAVAVINNVIYGFYSRFSYKECRIQFKIEWGLFKEMLSFAGWSFVGNIGIALRGPGVNILLNRSFGPAVNAARGLAAQVSSVVSNFVTNFQTAANPQITKRYAAGMEDSMASLIKSTAKYSFFLLAIVVVPLYVRADQVLKLWLESVPELTLQFLRLSLIVALLNSMVGPFTTGLQATGRIKVFQIVIALIMLAELPLAYFALKLEIEPFKVVYVTIGTELIALIARIVLLDRQISINVWKVLCSIVLRCAAVCLLMFLLPAFLQLVIPVTLPGLVLLCIISLMWSAGAIWIVGLDKKERGVFCSIVKSRIFTKA